VVGVVEGSVPDYFLVNRPDENRVRCKFEYGPTILYGSETPPVGPFKSTTVSQSHGVWANIDGLEPNTVYHYRLVAYTDEVTVNGADMVFKTSDQPAIVGVL
jgi:phosphodiesterase/alkaline phosphatase D-like protein